MKECVQDKFFISFLIFIGGFSYFIGLSNNKQIKEVENNNIYYVEK